jgi:hypothetical protein
MRKAAASILLLLLCLTSLYAQEDGNDPSVEPDWDVYDTDLYAFGDQLFLLSLGTMFPAVFVNNGKVINHNFSPPVGGMLSLSYNFFLNSHFFAGAEISFMFNATLGKNTVYIIPAGIRAGYQFLLWRFEFPVGLTVGMTWHRLLNLSYYGFFMKGSGSAYYRFNSEWSFGLDASWGWFPEWTKDPKKNVDGNIVTLTFSARYHF